MKPRASPHTTHSASEASTLPLCTGSGWYRNEGSVLESSVIVASGGRSYFTSSNDIGAPPKPSLTTRGCALLIQNCTGTGAPVASTFHVSKVPAGTVTDSDASTLSVIVV